MGSRAPARPTGEALVEAPQRRGGGDLVGAQHLADRLGHVGEVPDDQRRVDPVEQRKPAVEVRADHDVLFFLKPIELATRQVEFALEGEATLVVAIDFQVRHGGDPVLQ